MEALISVIIPVYNIESSLPRCIDSVLNQTYSNLEIILVDDGSTDSSGEICDNYAKKDNRIIVIHKENGGISTARNAGLERVTGEYIMLLDSDDFIPIYAIEKMYTRIMADDSDMVMGKHVDWYEDGKEDGAFCEWFNDGIIAKDEVFKKMGTDNYYPVSVWGKLYKKCMFDGIEFPSLRCGEDLWVFCSIIKKCEKISILDEKIYYYYQRSDSVTHKKSEKIKYDELVASLYAANFLYNNSYKSSAIYWYQRSIFKAIHYEDKKSALKIFEQYFNKSERKEILRKCRWITKVKWIALRSPVLYKLFKLVA